MKLASPRPELAHNGNDNMTLDQEWATYLKGFTRLGDQIFHSEPIPSATAEGDSQIQPPDLIVICSWLYAHFKHIAKYTKAYQQLYPTAPILLLKQDGPDLMWRPTSWQMENLKPAVSVIQRLKQDVGRSPTVLLHVFSNGGSFTACQLADAYALCGSSSLLPISALVIDSAPSIPDMRSGYVAMSQGLPKSLPGPLRLIGGGLMYGLMASAAIVSSVAGVEGTISGMRRKLNDPAGPFMANGVRRMYIYSETDELVPWQHVEMHAGEAKERLNERALGRSGELVRMEKFEGSRHVGHVMIDGERYWKAVTSCWASTIDGPVRSP